MQTTGFTSEAMVAVEHPVLGQVYGRVLPIRRATLRLHADADLASGCRRLQVWCLLVAWCLLVPVACMGCEVWGCSLTRLGQSCPADKLVRVFGALRSANGSPGMRHVMPCSRGWAQRGGVSSASDKLVAHTCSVCCGPGVLQQLCRVVAWGICLGCHLSFDVCRPFADGRLSRRQSM